MLDSQRGHSGHLWHKLAIPNHDSTRQRNTSFLYLCLQQCAWFSVDFESTFFHCFFFSRKPPENGWLCILSNSPEGGERYQGFPRLPSPFTPTLSSFLHVILLVSDVCQVFENDKISIFRCPWLCTERFCQAVELICMLRLTLFFINCSGTSMHTKLAFEKLVVVPEQRNEKSWTSNIFFLIFKERHFTMKLNLKQFFKRVSHTHNAQVKIISVSYLRRDKVPSNFIIAFKNPIWNFPEKLFYSKQLTAC